MCCCGKPTINGQRGYRWQPNDAPGVYPVNPPAIEDGDELLYDEPGRCGGTDSHSFHYRVVRRLGRVLLLVRHGGGDEEFPLSGHELPATLAGLDDNARYWLLNTIYHTLDNAANIARAGERQRWVRAAAEKRIKTRKRRGQDAVKVWIEPRVERVPA